MTPISFEGMSPVNALMCHPVTSKGQEDALTCSTIHLPLRMQNHTAEKTGPFVNLGASCLPGRLGWLAGWLAGCGRSGLNRSKVCGPPAFYHSPSGKVDPPRCVPSTYVYVNIYSFFLRMYFYSIFYLLEMMELREQVWALSFSTGNCSCGFSFCPDIADGDGDVPRNEGGGDMLGRTTPRSNPH